jgi:hypothetical protein
MNPAPESSINMMYNIPEPLVYVGFLLIKTGTRYSISLPDDRTFGFCPAFS